MNAPVKAWIFGLAILIGANVALADPDLPAKELPAKELPAKESSAKKVRAKRTAHLPAYKKKKKIHVDFTATTESQAVVIGPRISIEASEKDQARAAKAVHEDALPVTNVRKPTLGAATPVVVEEVVNTPKPTPVIPVQAKPMEIPPAPTPLASALSSASPSVALDPPPTEAPVERTPPLAAGVMVRAKLPTAHPTADDDNADSPVRIVVRGGSLAAHYSALESDLQDGATSLAFGLARQRGDFEARGIFEVGHGLDQAITPRNTRFLVLRGDLNYLPLRGAVTPLLGLGLGYGDFNVFSYRVNSDGSLTVRDHADTSSLILQPAVGVRLQLSSFTVDLSEEYMALLGGDSASALGGWLTALTLGFPFSW